MAWDGPAGTDDQHSMIWGTSRAGLGLAPIRRLTNLTNADMNEEAANSQALATQQSLVMSSLCLASQASQGNLQLLC
jgi:hypothetical protein